jgi:hypothetical protein
MELDRGVAQLTDLKGSNKSGRHTYFCKYLPRALIATVRPALRLPELVLLVSVGRERNPRLIGGRSQFVRQENGGGPLRILWARLRDGLERG